MKLTVLLTLLFAVSACATSEPPKQLVRVGPSNYSAEQVEAICRSEALNTRAAVRASGPSRVTVNTQPASTGGGFAGGFADSFSRQMNSSGPSGREEGKAAYAACAARNGYLLR